MTPAELKTLIESDSEALGHWNAGRHAACATRCGDIAPTVRRLVTADEIQLHASKNGTWAAITLARESVETPLQIRGVCITFLDWIRSKRSVDFDLPEVQAMVAGLIMSTLVSQEQAAQLDAMADAKQTFTTDDVQQAMGV